MSYKYEPLTITDVLTLYYNTACVLTYRGKNVIGLRYKPNESDCFEVELQGESGRLKVSACDFSVVMPEPTHQHIDYKKAIDFERLKKLHKT